MTGFLWSDDADSFFGESIAPSSSSRDAKKPKKITPVVVPGASSDSAITVTKLNEWIKSLLTQGIPTVWVSGEIGNLVQSSAGHVYFTLKDATGQISAVLWRSTFERLGVDLREGMAVLLQGRLDVYSPRGSYQLVVQKIEEQGIGALQAAFRKLYNRLHREGLFDADRKKEIPQFPQRIGFVTSPSGAAVHDFTQVLRRRWPAAKVLIIPSKVQGDGAAEEIARGIEVANIVRPKLDVLVVGRGGGSLEDLWAFNEEIVVRALVDSEIPTISAVGHEIDVTLSDLAADVRALTPTEAAERVAPSQSDVLEFLALTQDRLLSTITNQYARAEERLAAVISRPLLENPERLLEYPTQRLDEAEQLLDLAIGRVIENAQAKLQKYAEVLDALSPLRTLGRGYSLTMKDSGELLTDVLQLEVGMEIETRLENGTIRSRVLQLHPKDSAKY